MSSNPSPTTLEVEEAEVDLAALGLDSGAEGDGNTAKDFANVLFNLGPKRKVRSRKGEKNASERATEDELRELVERIAIIATTLYVWWLASGTGMTDSEQESLEMTDDEAEMIARPLARILERSWINKTYGKGILSSGEWMSFAMALMIYAKRTQPALRRKFESRAVSRANRRVANVSGSEIAQSPIGTEGNGLGFPVGLGQYATE